MLEGTATRDFNGRPIADEFSAIQAKARVNGFSIDEVEKLDIKRDPLRAIGGALEDGSVILTDLPSMQQKNPKAFAVNLNGHEFSGTYEGVIAIKANSRGSIEKLACGQCGPLLRDGQLALSLKTPADLVVLSDGKGGYNAVVSGVPGSNSIQITR
jgi:hypothetical protein